MYTQTEGQEGCFILSYNNKEIKFSRNVNIINDYVSINLNDKKITNKIYESLKIKAMEDYDNFFRISELITEYVEELIYDEEFALEQCNSVNPVDIFKGVSLQFEDVGKDPVDAFLDYIKILENYLGVKLLMFINIKEYFNDEEMVYIYNQLLFNKTRFIILQSNETKTVDERERIYIVDEDFCEL